MYHSGQLRRWLPRPFSDIYPKESLMFRKMLVPLLAVGLVGIVTAQQEAETIDTA